jgi:DNA-binding winged helix-turn-helix (wHTH) protein
MRLLFGAFEIDLDRFEVRKDGARRHLEPQVFEVLAHLARHRDRLVPKEELLDQVWGNRFVSESAVTSRIRAARAVLDDNGRDQQVIRTVHGRGYRFVADCSEASDSRANGKPDARDDAKADDVVPASSTPAAAPGRPGIRPPVLERDDQLRRLGRAVHDLLAGQGGVVCISGAAGLGKTTLVRRATEDAGADVAVLLASCEDLSTPRALGPFRDMLLPSGGLLVDEVGPGFDAGAVLTRLRDVVRADGPPVIVVEDVHWADDATVDLLRLLVRQAPALPALVVLSYRDEDIGPGHPMRRLLGSLRSPVAHLRLQPLSTSAVALMTTGTRLAADEVHTVTGGNPFFVSEVVANPGTAVPASVRDAVLARLDQTSAAARHGLQVLSVIPARAERWLAEALLPDADDVLHEAERRGLLAGDATSVWFRHELARRVIDADLTAAERTAHHRGAAHVLATRRADPARVLHHAALGALPDLVREQALLAAAQAVAAGAHRQAAAHLDLLLSYRDQLPADVVAGALTDRAHSLYLLNRFAESQRLAVESVAMWESIGDPAQLGRALIGLARTGLWAVGPRFAEQAARRAVAAAERASHREDDGSATVLLAQAHAELARARGNLATLGPVSEPGPSAVEHAAQAVELARRSGREELVAHTLTYLGAERLSNGDPGGRDDLDEAVRIAAGDPRVEYVTRGCVNASGAAFRSGEPELALEYVRTGLAGCADGEFFAGEYRLDLTRSVIQLSTGSWDEAEAGLRDLVDRPGEPGLMRPMATALLARLLARRGDDEAGALLARAVADITGSDEPHLVGPVAAAAAELHWLGGTGDLPAFVRDAYDLAVRRRHLVSQAELATYAARCGSVLRQRRDRPDPEQPPLPGPWSPALAGDHRGAADGWAALHERYEQAVETWAAGDHAAAAADLTDLGAAGTLRRLAKAAV